MKHPRLARLAATVAGIAALAFGSEPANSYPDFIGYGYTSCLTCHYNGAGNGPLTDYGRALFAAEIAAKPFWRPNVTNEELAEESGILGSTPLPWWVRLGAKYRGLYYSVNPGPGFDSSTAKVIHMQADINTAFHLDQDLKNVVVASFGFAPKPRGADPRSPDENRNAISREYYYRRQWTENIWTYIGFMDKVFGIRTPDHTLYSRKMTGLGQNDQAHGLVFQYTSDKHEFMVNPFVGHLQQESDLRQRGVSFFYEHEPREKIRVGSSLLYSQNTFVKQMRMAGHGRFGVGNSGSNVLLELGVIRDTPEARPTSGVYTLAQSMMLLARGLNFMSVGEYFRRDLSSSESDVLRWGLGLLYFPAQRVELRADAVNQKTIAPQGIPDDSWTIRAQLHLSL